MILSDRPLIAYRPLVCNAVNSGKNGAAHKIKQFLNRIFPGSFEVSLPLGSLACRFRLQFLNRGNWCSRMRVMASAPAGAVSAAVPAALAGKKGPKARFNQ